jgi:hypothetical protein
MDDTIFFTKVLGICGKKMSEQRSVGLKDWHDKKSSHPKILQIKVQTS